MSSASINLHSHRIVNLCLGFIHFLLLGQSGCLNEITLPECATLSECPAEYSFCRNGYCLKESESCAVISDNDGCCPSLPRRDKDSDCMMFSTNVGGILPSKPLPSEDGGIFVNFLEAEGGPEGAADNILNLVSIDRSGNLLWSKKVGKAGAALPPLKTSVGVGSPYNEGFMFFDPETGDGRGLITAHSPFLAVSDGMNMIAFVDASMTLYVSDVTKEVAKKVYEQSGGTISMFFTAGSLFVLEKGRYLSIDPGTAKIKQEVQYSGEVATGASYADRRVAWVVKGTMKSILKILKEAEGKFTEINPITLRAEDFFDPIFDADGNIFVVSVNGFIKVVKKNYETSEFSIDELKVGVLHEIHPATGDGGFIYAFAFKNSEVIGLHYDFPLAGGGSMLIKWSFSLPFHPSAPLVVTSDNRVVVVEKGGVVISIWGK